MSEQALATTGNSDVSIYPSKDEWGMISDIAVTLVASKVFRGASTKEEAIAKILQGRELGLPPVYSIQRLHYIKNSPAIDGQGMLALIRRSGDVIYNVSHPDDTTAICKMKRIGDEEFTEVKWTVGDAQKASLMKKDNWSNYTKAMLRWRAIVDCARIVAPDIIGGLFLFDELGLSTGEGGQILDADVESIETLKGGLEGEKAKAVEASQVLSTSPTKKVEEAKHEPETKKEPEKKQVPGSQLKMTPPVQETETPPVKQSEPTTQKPTTQEGEVPPEEMQLRKTLAQQIHIAYSDRMKSVSMSLGRQFTEMEKNLLLSAWMSEKKIPFVSGEGMKVHLSKTPSGKLETAHNVMKDGGSFITLKVLVGRVLGEPEETAPETKEEPKPEPPQVTEPVREDKGESKEGPLAARKNVQEMKDKYESAWQFTGLSVYINIIKKHGLTDGSEQSEETYTKTLEELQEAYDKLEAGADPSSIM